MPRSFLITNRRYDFNSGYHEDNHLPARHGSVRPSTTSTMGDSNNLRNSLKGTSLYPSALLPYAHMMIPFGNDDDVQDEPQDLSMKPPNKKRDRSPIVHQTRGHKSRIIMHHHQHHPHGKQQAMMGHDEDEDEDEMDETEQSRESSYDPNSDCETRDDPSNHFPAAIKALLSSPATCIPVPGGVGRDSISSISPSGAYCSSASSSSGSSFLQDSLLDPPEATGDPSLGENHICPDCGKRYSTSSNLARHRQTHRSVTDKKARKCPHCDKVYVSMPAYSMHVRTHSQGCQCKFCGKCFSRPWLLQGHIRTHTGEKPFKCTICTKAFADKSNLRAHVQTHSSSKPYVCERCGKAFALKSYLYKHEESSCMRVNRGPNSHRRNSNVSIAVGANHASTAPSTSKGKGSLSKRPSSSPSSSSLPYDRADPKDLHLLTPPSSSSSRSGPFSPISLPSPSGSFLKSSPLSSPSSSSSMSPSTSSPSSSLLHPRKAYVMQYTASLMNLQNIQAQKV